MQKGRQVLKGVLYGPALAGRRGTEWGVGHLRGQVGEPAKLGVALLGGVVQLPPPATPAQDAASLSGAAEGLFLHPPTRHPPHRPLRPQGFPGQPRVLAKDNGGPPLHQPKPKLPRAEVAVGDPHLPRLYLGQSLGH